MPQRTSSPSSSGVEGAEEVIGKIGRGISSPQPPPGSPPGVLGGDGEGRGGGEVVELPILSFIIFFSS